MYHACKHEFFWKKNDEFHSFAADLSRTADVIVLYETWFTANTCHDVIGYIGLQTYRADKPGDGVSVSIRNCKYIDPYGDFL